MEFLLLGRGGLAGNKENKQWFLKLILSLLQFHKKTFDMKFAAFFEHLLFFSLFLKSSVRLLGSDLRRWHLRNRLAKLSYHATVVQTFSFTDFMFSLPGAASCSHTRAHTPLGKGKEKAISLILCTQTDAQGFQHAPSSGRENASQRKCSYC